jgi:HEXXH motif-containing protein
MRVLEQSQQSHRRLALRALLDQLTANPAALGQSVDLEQAWRILVEAEQRDPAAVSDILMYPTVGVWLTRALHYTAPTRTTTWTEVGYLQLIIAAAAVKCGYPCTVRVPVWHGVVSLPTVGHIRVPGAFPVGSVTVVSAGAESRVQVNRAVAVSLRTTSKEFTPARRQVTTSRGLSLHTWIENADPYHGFGEPRPPAELTDSEFTEWRKLVDEAWDILTLDHPAFAGELAAGLLALGPIEPDLDTVGASSPAAFGGIRLSATGSAIDFAEALVHEMQHSKLNALLELVKLTDDDNGNRHLAPWRDDPRPLVGIVHGVYAFTCGVEFWLAQETLVNETDTRRMAFNVAYRRLQVRRALTTLTASRHLTLPGRALVDVVSRRLEVCERTSVGHHLSGPVTMIVDDHRALWRLRHARPDAATVDRLAAAWLAGSAPPDLSTNSHVVADPTQRRLPSNRRTLLRAKATEPEVFAALVRRPSTLPGATPRADAALCTGDYPGAATIYQAHLRTEPSDAQAWVGLGLALQAQGRDATALLEHPELTAAVHRRVCAHGGPAPNPTALSSWITSAL